MNERGIPVYLDNRRIPAFHPIDHKDEGAWFPGNDAAALLVATNHVLQDVGRLYQIMVSLPDRDAQLLAKYVVVELCSLLPVLDRLAGLAFKCTAPDAGGSPTHKITRDLKGAYDAQRKAARSDLVTIRNKVGAHRGLANWRDIVQIYESLDPFRFAPLYNAACALFNHLKDLPLYAWLRREEGRMCLLDTRLAPFQVVPRSGGGGRTCGATAGSGLATSEQV